VLPPYLTSFELDLRRKSSRATNYSEKSAASLEHFLERWVRATPEDLTGSSALQQYSERAMIDTRPSL
jgi:hypothetical protein